MWGRPFDELTVTEQHRLIAYADVRIQEDHELERRVVRSLAEILVGGVKKRLGG